MACQVCSSSDTVEILDLGYHPPPLVLPTKQQLREPETRYPLPVVRCRSCGLVQLDYIVDPRVLFLNYTYESSASRGFVMHLRELSAELYAKFKLSGRDLVVDIGSNDGTALEGYKQRGVRVLGIEPSNIGHLAANRGVPTLKGFFGPEIGKQVLVKEGKAKIVTALNVFAHVAPVDSFMNGVDMILDDSGAFVTESLFLLDLVSKLEYDAIYHEHLRYYSLKSLMSLLEHFGFEAFDATRIPTHGGSIRVFAGRRGKHQVSDTVQRILNEENRAGLESPDTFSDFARRVSENRLKLKSLLWRIKREGKRIVGVGAPARSSTLLNYCMIGPDLLEYVAETSKIKVGKYTPGTHIPIIEESQVYVDPPDYLLLLSWHLKDDVMANIKDHGYRGRFILPLPDVEVV